MGLPKAPRLLLLSLGYAALIQVAYLAALLLRFEGEVPSRYWTGYLVITPVFTLLSLAGFFVAGLYHGLWRYASTVTLFQVFKGVTLSAATLAVIAICTPDPLFPRSLIAMVWVWELVLLGGLRFASRVFSERLIGAESDRPLRTLIVGADHTGIHLIQEMRRAPAQIDRPTPVGFIDDDSRLTGHMIEGIRVFGTIADLPRAIQELRAQMVVISAPDMQAKVVREIARFCEEAEVRVRTLPGLSDLHHGKTALSQMRDVRIEDLLGRQPVQLDLHEVGAFLRGQRVMVTGAGGSIGSELARQVAGFSPAELVLLDHAEHGLYYVQNELCAQYPDLTLYPVVADIKDLQGIEMAFERFRPNVVFHAAAHKHVPLLEANPREAVLNNIVGTRNLVRASDQQGVGKFVLISTDKAVNPTSVMGVSKRVCEMILQSHSQRSRTQFVAVRFGNVLGSEGSVIPLFQRQIQRGGPITVTHPETRRYFMTIPEAVRLVLQAGAMGQGGEVMLLDMGEQVRIVDLARQLVRMSGLREGEDIEIVFTGLRPGEKLYEELHSDSEQMRITRHQRILVWDLDARDEEGLMHEIKELVEIAKSCDPPTIKERLCRLVPEYREPRHDPMEPTPATPLVSLPVAAAPPRVIPERKHWSENARGVLEGAIALGVLMASAPLWGLLWLEARHLGHSKILRHDVRIGKNRRRMERRVSRAEISIDRRSFGRRTQDLLGAPIRCARFRADLGPVSRWIARHHMNRLPYVINVMRREMAWVGPRPEREEFVLRWTTIVPEYHRRFSILPGVMGLAQIAGGEGGDTDAMIRRAQYDLHYIENRSLLLDIRTALRSVMLLTRREPQRVPPRKDVVVAGSMIKSAADSRT